MKRSDITRIISKVKQIRKSPTVQVIARCKRQSIGDLINDMAIEIKPLKK